MVRLVAAWLCVGTLALPVAASSASLSAKSKQAPAVTESSAAQRKMSKLRHNRSTAQMARARKRKSSRHRRRRYVERFHTSSYAENITQGDVIAGEDAVVRQAAVDALGNMNGTIVAVDPTSGQILAMVNQKLALSEGAQPCSTIKLAVALAGLSEGVIDKDTPLRVGRRARINLTEALAHSNNQYFALVGRKLGFEKVSEYAHQFGLGELAGWEIRGEHLGVFPEHELAARRGGVGKMCSFGESISMTPLQLAALVSAIANGGTLYYLQHPRTAEAAEHFHPRVKRELEIANLVPEMSDGMRGAVEYGTAKSLGWNFSEEEVLGKTGTCSNDGTRFGWFASYARTQYGHIVTVVFLQGGRPTYGPKAAEIAGKMYRSLYDHEFFAGRRNASAEPREEKSDTASGAMQ